MLRSHPAGGFHRPGRSTPSLIPVSEDETDMPVVDVNRLAPALDSPKDIGPVHVEFGQVDADGLTDVVGFEGRVDDLVGVLYEVGRFHATGIVSQIAHAQT